jgi:putative transcriptional regulator
LKLPRLKEVRELHGWSQARLADESGVSRDSISNYETGQREAWPATAKRLADALDVEIEDLARPKVAAPPSPPPIAEEEWRKPLSVEWALTAPDTEFDSRLKTATLPEVMALLPLNLHAEDVSGDDRIRILERVSKIVSRFQILGGPFDLAKDWEDRSASEDRRDQETA